MFSDFVSYLFFHLYEADLLFCLDWGPPRTTVELSLTVFNGDMRRGTSDANVMPSTWLKILPPPKYRYKARCSKPNPLCAKARLYANESTFSLKVEIPTFCGTKERFPRRGLAGEWHFPIVFQYESGYAVAMINKAHCWPRMTGILARSSYPGQDPA